MKDGIIDYDFLHGVTFKYRKLFQLDLIQKGQLQLVKSVTTIIIAPIIENKTERFICYTGMYTYREWIVEQIF